MCRKKTLSWSQGYAPREQGFSLIMVLAIMVIIALMVIAGSQVSNTEMRISSNDADRKHAFSLAERALQLGERRAASATITGDTGLPLAESDIQALFSADCGSTEGMCLPADGDKVTQPAWERENIFSGNTEDNSVGTNIEGGFRSPRYIIEYLGVNGIEGRMFRVTSRAWGANENTVVTLQSYIAMPL